MGIKYINHTNKEIIIAITESALRAVQDYPLAPNGFFEVQPNESGKIKGWLWRDVAFSHEATSAQVNIGMRPLRAEGLDASARSTKNFRGTRSKTIRGLSIIFTPVK